jgi:hypothetical protein
MNIVELMKQHVSPEMAANPGKDAAWVIKRVMKRSGGKADPSLITECWHMFNAVHQDIKENRE